jgi:hypothetical protein
MPDQFSCSGQHQQTADDHVELKQIIAKDIDHW